MTRELLPIVEPDLSRLGEPAVWGERPDPYALDERVALAVGRAIAEPNVPVEIGRWPRHGEHDRELRRWTSRTTSRINRYTRLNDLPMLRAFVKPDPALDVEIYAVVCEMEMTP